MSRRILVNQLAEARREYCGIGTKAVKMKLNRLARTCARAKAFRLALEIEDCSTLGKKYFGEWSTHYYQKKKELIHELIKLFQDNNWIYGKHKSDNYHARYIVYFEIPSCAQISFHCNLDVEVPDYQKEWDGKRNSTLAKIEKALIEYFDQERDLLFK